MIGYKDFLMYAGQFPCLPGPQSVRGCSASELCSILPRRTCLRLILQLHDHK